MEEIYDQQGRVVAKLRGNMIFDRSGSKVIGYLNDNYVKRQTNGRHVGYLCDGCFVDMTGFPVAVVAGANRGPALPRPVPAQRRGPLPGSPVPSLPYAPMKFWSTTGWGEFLP